MIDKATAERAFVLCVTAEPHDRLECRAGHLMASRRQLSATPFAGAIGGHDPTGAPANGVAGCAPPGPAAGDSALAAEVDAAAAPLTEWLLARRSEWAT